MEHIITEGQEEAYQSEIQYQNAQIKFRRFMRSAEGWRKFEFISTILKNCPNYYYGISSNG